MRAAFISRTGPPDVIRVGDVPDPVPGPRQVLVRVRACAVNPIDTSIRAGSVAMPLQFPFVVGCDLAGEVAAHDERKLERHGHTARADRGIDRIDGAGPHPHEHLPRPGHRIWNIPHANDVGRTGARDERRPHGRSAPARPRFESISSRAPAASPASAAVAATTPRTPRMLSANRV